MIYKKSSFLISLFLIVFLSVNIQSLTASVDLNQVFSEERALTKIVSDPAGDIDNSTYPELDLVGAWMGDDEDHLFFNIEYAFMQDSQTFVNITIRTETNQLFLIMVFVTPTFNGLMMTHATSLVEDGKNTGEDCFFVEYPQARIQRDIEIRELSFYIDWIHLGRAHQELDLVFYTGYSTYSDFDIMPNQEFVTYKPAIADINISFAFDPSEEISEFTSDSQYCKDTYGGNSNLIETVTVTQEITVTEKITVTQAYTDTISISNSDDLQNETTVNPVLPLNTSFALAPFVLWGLFTIYKRKY